MFVYLYACDAEKVSGDCGQTSQSSQSNTFAGLPVIVFVQLAFSSVLVLRVVSLTF